MRFVLTLSAAADSYLTVMAASTERSGPDVWEGQCGTKGKEKGNHGVATSGKMQCSHTTQGSFSERGLSRLKTRGGAVTLAGHGGGCGLLSSLPAARTPRHLQQQYALPVLR